MRSRALSVMALMAVGLLVGLGAPSVQAGRTWTVLAGPWGPQARPSGPGDYSVVSQAFYPRTIEVAVGDEVTWQIQGFHTVTFLSGQKPPDLEVHEGKETYFNPKVFFPSAGRKYDGTGYRNSGGPPEYPKPFKYSLRFTKAGTYQYLCMVHGPAMSGRVVVKQSAMGTPAAAKAQGLKDLAATFQAGRAAFRALEPTVKGNAVTVTLTGDAGAGFSILRFTRNPLVVRRGTTVTWVMHDPFEIHTVTFTSGAKPPDFVIVEPQKQGPPKLRVNPKAAAPTKQTKYDGTGFVNSGILYPEGTPPSLPKSFSLTFTKSGRYAYYCVVHYPVEGMVGTIIVR